MTEEIVTERRKYHWSYALYSVRTVRPSLCLTPHPEGLLSGGAGDLPPACRLRFVTEKEQVTFGQSTSSKMDEEDYVASEEELMEVESSTATTEDMDDSGPSTPRLSMSLSPVKPLPKPKRKARGKAKGKRKVAKARQCSQDSQSELSQMEAADEPQNSRERSGMPKKHKELPKPVIPIYLHHPLPFKNAEYLRKVRVGM